MLSQHPYIILTLCILSQTIHGTTFSCGIDSQCVSDTLNCADGTNCVVICNGNNACNGATINCPDNNDCNVQCTGYDACPNANINCPSGDATCIIDCAQSQSCLNINVTGGIGSLYIDCRASNACFNGRIDGRYTSELTVASCAITDSCIGLDVYCPPNNPSKVCTIEGDDDMGGDINNNINLYARNGWDDISISTTSTSRVGTMYCGPSLSTSCNIKSGSSGQPWECDAAISCISDKPTLTPSKLPTTIPPTVNPTPNPTMIPSMIPSKPPTVNPSINPTPNPTTNPTSNPTSNPTVFPGDPTKSPVIPPTLSPTTPPTHIPSGPPTGQPTGPPTNNPVTLTSDFLISTSTSFPTINTNSAEIVTTITTTTIHTTNGNEWNVDNNDTKIILDEVLIVLLSLLIVIILVIAIVWFIYVKKRRISENKSDMHEYGEEMNRIKSISMNNSNLNSNDSVPGSISTLNVEAVANTKGCLIVDQILQSCDNDHNVNHNDKIDREEFYVRAISDYISVGNDQLSLEENEIYLIIQTTKSGWWYAMDRNGNDGWIPSNYINKCNRSEQIELRELHQQSIEQEGDDNQSEFNLSNLKKFEGIVFDIPGYPVIDAPINHLTVDGDVVSSSDDDDDDQIYDDNEQVAIISIGKTIVTDHDTNDIQSDPSSSDTDDGVL